MGPTEQGGARTVLCVVGLQQALPGRRQEQKVPNSCAWASGKSTMQGMITRLCELALQPAVQVQPPGRNYRFRGALEPEPR